MSRKSFNIHLINNTSTTNDNDDNGNIVTKITLFGKIIEYVWIQGMIVSNLISNQLIIDDGTGCITVILDPSMTSSSNNDSCIVDNNIDGSCNSTVDYILGDYVLVQGILYKGNLANTSKVITCINAMILSKIENPNMETLWYLEVIDSYKKIII